MPSTEEDRKYIITACYMRFGILMLIYGIVLLVSRFLLEASNLILFLQYVCGVNHNFNIGLIMYTSR